MRGLALALVLACGPAWGQEVLMPDPGPGYPPKMGDVTGTLGDISVAWETFDFSIGAFDASVWVGHFEGPHKLTLIGYTPGDPDDDEDRLRVTGAFAGSPGKGALQAVTVAIFAGADWDGKRLSSEGQAAEVVVERIRPPPRGTGYGSASGRISAVLCPAGGARAAPCRAFQARFDTTVQFGG